MKYKQDQKKWALEIVNEQPGYSEPFLCGVFCWRDGANGGVRTFRTRREAREAQGSCCHKTVPVKVRVEFYKRRF